MRTGGPTLDGKCDKGSASQSIFLDAFPALLKAFRSFILLHDYSQFEFNAVPWVYTFGPFQSYCHYRNFFLIQTQGTHSCEPSFHLLSMFYPLPNFITLELILLGFEISCITSNCQPPRPFSKPLESHLQETIDPLQELRQTDTTLFNHSNPANIQHNPIPREPPTNTTR